MKRYGVQPNMLVIPPQERALLFELVRHLADQHSFS